MPAVRQPEASVELLLAAPPRGPATAGPAVRPPGAGPAGPARRRRRRRTPAPRTARSGRVAGVPSANVIAVPGVLPALVGQAAARAAARTRRSRPRRGRRSSLTHARARSTCGRRAPGRRRRHPIGTARRRAHEQRRRVDRAVVDRRRRPVRGRVSTPSRTSCRIRPGCSSVDGRPWCPGSRASVCSVPRASDWSNGRAMNDASSESRPNSAMNHGAPAATAVRSGCAGSVMRSAPRSVWLRSRTRFSDSSSTPTTGACSRHAR